MGDKLLARLKVVYDSDELEVQLNPCCSNILYQLAHGVLLEHGTPYPNNGDEAASDLRARSCADAIHHAKHPWV